MATARREVRQPSVGRVPVGRAIVDRQTVHVPDVVAAGSDSRRAKTHPAGYSDILWLRRC